jgi:hypothetical protein
MVSDVLSGHAHGVHDATLATFYPLHHGGNEDAETDLT